MYIEDQVLMEEREAPRTKSLQAEPTASIWSKGFSLFCANASAMLLYDGEKATG
jgi:hypothetical protein